MQGLYRDGKIENCPKFLRRKIGFKSTKGIYYTSVLGLLLALLFVQDLLPE